MASLIKNYLDSQSNCSVTTNDVVGEARLQVNFSHVVSFFLTQVCFLVIYFLALFFFLPGNLSVQTVS